MPRSTALTKQHREMIAEIVAEVRANHRGSHELAAYAQRYGYSDRQLRRILLRAGIEWRQWVREQRLDAAARQLLGGRRVKLVTHNVGYAPDHLAEPFRTYTGLLPSEARRAGHVCRQLTSFKRSPPRSADIAARCRAVDHWTRLWTEAMHLHEKALPGTPVATRLGEARGCSPPPRPRPIPRGRLRRQQTLSEQFNEAARSQRATRAQGTPERSAA